ncbi:MAG: RNA polymerase sigma factor [Xanthomonadales bacterium]|nr:RNA polymerase sigma factor [Xanthomonadales bacterium]
MPNVRTITDYTSASLAELVAMARAGEREAYRHIMQRSNQRLFRTARAVLNDDAEAEDALQDGYVSAFAALGSFRGDAEVTTWLTRIVLNACYQRLRSRHPSVHLDQAEAAHDDTHILQFPTRYGMEDPANSAARIEIRGLIESAVGMLPEAFRVVFVLRDIEGCSIEETAQALGIREETVKTRLHRARRQLRDALHDSVETSLHDAFPFLGPRCARLTAAMMQRLDSIPRTPSTQGDS